MENRQSMSSVIAKLMGLDEMRPQRQPVPRQRVLSETYLQKVGAIGKRSRTYSQNILLRSKKRANQRTNYSNKDILPRGFLQSRLGIDGMQGMKPTITFDYENNGENGKSEMELKDEATPLPTTIVVLKPKISNAEHASRPSYLLDSQITIAWEAKKQLLERLKTTKVSQELWSRSSPRRSLGEMLSLNTTKSMSILDSGSSIGISSKKSCKYKSVTKLPVFSSNSTTISVKTNRVYMSLRSKNNNLVSNSSAPFTMSSKTDAETEDVESFHSHSATEGYSCDSSDVLSEQDSLIRSHEDSSISSNCLQMDEERLDSKVEAHQRSPNSVLKPQFMEDNPSNSDYCESDKADLHGPWMQLQLLKSESEENINPEMVTSSDDERSFYTDQHIRSMISIGAKESRDFSYLVDVLDELGFQGWNVEISFEKWHSPEIMAGPSIFDALEKKYGKQELWHKAERKLLFDRINIGMTEILRPQVGIHVFSKPLRRKMQSILRREVIEEELLTLLNNQEKGVDGVSEKAVGRGLWFDALDELDSLVREIETFLFDELAAEVACA